MKKIYYIVNAKIPTIKAHGIQIMEMCQAFADLGCEVELVIPKHRPVVNEDPFTFHDIRRVFSIRRLWSIDTTKQWGRVGFWFAAMTFAKSVALFALRRDGIFYTRDEFLALILLLLNKRVVWEAHMGHSNLFVRLLVWLGLRIVVISQGLKDLYVAMGVASNKIHLAPDGADISRFDIELSQAEARQRLNLPLGVRIVLYKGSLGRWKGGDTLAQSVGRLKTENVLFVFIGGAPDDEAQLRSRFPNKNMLLLGNVPRQQTPIFQKASDVLVIPNSAKEDISKLYTSPMKMFGYMASGVPIVASDLPSLREVLGEREAVFFSPDDADSLANTIDQVLASPKDAQSRAKQALDKVRHYSWQGRAEKILAFIDTTTSRNSRH